MDNELFDLIRAINTLKTEVAQLSAEVRYLLKYPSLVAFNDYVPQREACKILRLSSKQLFNLRKSKELPYTLLHKRVFYKVSDLEYYFKNNTFKSSQLAKLRNQ